MLKLLSVVAACLLVVALVAGCGPLSEEEIAEIDVITQAAQVDPHCTNGDCEAFAQHCLDMGRVPMCLSSNITVCVGVAAASKVFTNHPDACRGTCTDPVVCN